MGLRVFWGAHLWVDFKGNQQENMVDGPKNDTLIRAPVVLMVAWVSLVEFQVNPTGIIQRPWGATRAALSFFAQRVCNAPLTT